MLHTFPLGGNLLRISSELFLLIVMRQFIHPLKPYAEGYNIAY